MRLTLLPLVSCLLLGCVHSTTLPHPASTGRLTQATAVRNAPVAEDRRELVEGALRDTVQLVRLDGEAACFDTKLRSLTRDPVVISESDVTLESDGRELQLTRSEFFHVQTSSEPGYRNVTRHTGRYEFVCVARGAAGRCVREERHEVLQTRRERVQFTVFHGGGMFCFEHGGSITPRTQELEFSYGGDAFVFELERRDGTPETWPVDSFGAMRPMTLPGFESTIALR